MDDDDDEVRKIREMMPPELIDDMNKIFEKLEETLTPEEAQAVVIDDLMKLAVEQGIIEGE